VFGRKDDKNEPVRPSTRSLDQASGEEVEPSPRRGPRTSGRSSKVGWRASQADWRKQIENEQSGFVLAEPPEPIEQFCPNCGEPMLASWGTTCGKCKPKLAAPKTVMLATADVVGMLSMTLGWMVVIKTPDPSQKSALIDLVDPIVVLTRAGAPASAGVRQIEFRDDFMSAGHAVIRRPQGFAQDAAFTIEDRKTPGPSANGTFVNGRKLTAGEVAMLGDGDIVRVGTTELHFKSLWLPPASVKS